MFHSVKNISTTLPIPNNSTSSSTVASSSTARNTVVLTDFYNTADGRSNTQIFTYRIGAEHEKDKIGAVYPMDLCEETIKDRFSSDSKFWKAAIKPHDVRVHINTSGKSMPELEIYPDSVVKIKEKALDSLPRDLPVGEYQLANLTVTVSKPQKESVLDKIPKPSSSTNPYHSFPATKDKDRRLSGLYRFDDRGQHLYLIEPKLLNSPASLVTTTQLNHLIYKSRDSSHYSDVPIKTLLNVQTRPSPMNEPPAASASAQQAPILPCRIHPDLRGLQFAPPVPPHAPPATAEQSHVYVNLTTRPEELAEQKNTAKDIAALQEKKAQLDREIASLLAQKKTLEDAEEAVVQQATSSRATRSMQPAQKEREAVAPQKSQPQKIALPES